jgi:dephospho-CoA kinase
MKIIGITGGIASGKSTVTRMFQALGGTSLSADVDARAVLSEGSPALATVFSLFPEVRRPDGSLDRAALAARIFSDPGDKKRLEAITHPAIISRMRDAIDAARASQDEGILFYEVPLLYERDLAGLFDAVIAVLATPSLQAERLQARELAAGRPALSDSDIAERLAAQMSPEEKARLADYVIRTDTPLSQTEEQVRQIWDQIKAR